MFAEVYPDSRKKWRWRIRSGGDTLADSGQGYAAKVSAKAGLNKVAPHVSDVREFSENPRTNGVMKPNYDELRTDKT